MVFHFFLDNFIWGMNSSNIVNVLLLSINF